MKALGIILIVAGIAMLIFKGFSYTKKEKVVDVGPIEINKSEKENVSWPMYAGGIAVLAGIVVLVMDRKKA
jgi:hypothetical protein